MNKEQLEMQEQIKKLTAQVSELGALVNKNNFTSTQTFNKSCVFSDRLRVPVFASAPTVAEIGDLFCLSTTQDLYICTTASTGGSGAVWTIVGTQS